MATTSPPSSSSMIQDFNSTSLIGPTPRGKQEYAELYELVKNQGLLDKQPAFYLYKTISSLGLMAISLTILVMVDTLWIQLLNAGLMSVAFAQVAFLGHDSGHQQMFRTLRKNDAMLMMVNFLTGLDRSWWIDKHHRHHRRPNDVTFDLDINLPFFAFTAEQATRKTGILRFFVKYQAFFLFPLMFFEGWSLRVDAAQYLLRRKNVKYPGLEWLAMAVHLTVYAGVLIYVLGPWPALAFSIVHHVVLGYYMSSVFAPNHKGMPMLEDGLRLDFIRQQALTARNVKGGALTTFYYGGLNYQIEHHLFPNMPRNRLKKVQPIVKKFCLDHDIPYHETGVIESWKEIVKSLYVVSGALRGSKTRTASPEA